MHENGYLMRRAVSVLLVIDVQERLAPAIHDGAQLVERCAWLLKLAARLGVPALVTEHCSDKIGVSVPAIRDAAVDACTLQKRSFSAVRDGCLSDSAVDEAEDVIVCGSETHVCVQQTALDLAHAGKRVFLVADATASRRPLDRELALARMRAHGVVVVSSEMVAFEWLGSGDDPRFGEINREFLR